MLSLTFSQGRQLFMTALPQLHSFRIFRPRSHCVTHVSLTCRVSLAYSR